MGTMKSAGGGRVITVSPAKVRVARLIVKRADEGKGTASEAIRAMAKAERPTPAKSAR